jgi:hypothetical protein
MKVTIKDLNGNTMHGVIHQNELFDLLESFKDSDTNLLITQRLMVDDTIEVVHPINGITNYEEK